MNYIGGRNEKNTFEVLVWQWNLLQGWLSILTGQSQVNQERLMGLHTMPGQVKGSREKKVDEEGLDRTKGKWDLSTWLGDIGAKILNIKLRDENKNLGN